jgi:hypothetical protein
MIKLETISVYISYRNITHYRKLGYNPILNEKLEIKSIDLPSSSHVRIDVICEICKKENNIQYHKYIVNRKRHGFYGCRSCSRQKAALTSIELYGVDNYSKTDEFIKRVEKTNFKKYGFKTNLLNPLYSNRIKKILKDKYGTENFYQINRNKKPLKKRFALLDLENLLNQSLELSESKYCDTNISNNYLIYKNECRRITKSYLKSLFNFWDGLDFYDREDISENFNLPHNDKNYPTVDHKISIYYGFNNGISPNEIGHISNLAITKRSINSSKRDNIYT